MDPLQTPAWLDLPSGATSRFLLPVVSRATGSPIELPVIVLKGNQPGKTLLITSGVHGDEFEGMAALHAVCAELDPAQLCGVFVAVPVVNPPAFESGLRTNPDDRQDLARVFPGDSRGTVTEQIAWTLTHRFIRHADFYCDLHSAGQFYRMPPLAGYQLRGEPMLSLQREAARCFGLPFVWGTKAMPGRSLSAAGDFGVAAIYAEITGEGRCKMADVEKYLFGIRQLLGLLSITNSPARPCQPEWHVEDDREQAGYLQVQNRAPRGGLFLPRVDVWQTVHEGEPIGTIVDAFGAVQHTALATCSGRVVFLRTFSRVLAGDALVTIATGI